MFTYGLINASGVIQSNFTQAERSTNRLHAFISAEPGFDASSYVGQQMGVPAPIGTKITHLAFRRRLTFAERVAIETAGETNASIRVLLGDLAASKFVDMAYDNTIDGLTMLETDGLIGAGRAAEILEATVTEDEAA